MWSEVSKEQKEKLINIIQTRPDTFNLLNSTMLKGVEWKRWINVNMMTEFNNIGRCWMKMLDQYHSAKWTCLTCWIQNVEWCWMEMLNQSFSTGWPDEFNILNSTMVFTPENKKKIIHSTGWPMRLTRWMRKYLKPLVRSLICLHRYYFGRHVTGTCSASPVVWRSKRWSKQGIG